MEAYGRSREQRHQNHSAYSSTRFNAICDERRRPHRKRRKRMLMGDTINYSTSGGRRQWRWEYRTGRRSGDRALPSSLINRPVDASYGVMRRSPGKTRRPILSSDDMNETQRRRSGCLWKKHRNRSRLSTMMYSVEPRSACSASNTGA